MNKEDVKDAAKNFKSKIVVKGKTVIDHKLRIRLNIGCNAYVILDYFKTLRKLDYLEIEKATGFPPEAVDKLIESLYNQQLLTYNKTRTSLKASSKFYNQDLIQRQFNDFWNLKLISKKQKTSAWPDTMERARKAFREAVELEGFDYIMERRNLYIRYLELPELEYRNIMSAARFLSTAYKEYNSNFESFLPQETPAAKPITKKMLDQEYE